jgi:hypothetical protein
MKIHTTSLLEGPLTLTPPLRGTPPNLGEGTYLQAVDEGTDFTSQWETSNMALRRKEKLCGI